MEHLKKHWGDDSDRTFYGLDMRPLFWGLPLGGRYDMTMVSEHFVDIEDPKIDNMRVEVSTELFPMDVTIKNNLRSDIIED